jgi:3-hydroxyisobutyrate dehydrogenase-like beta-hydroxyacid dehydrogenase
MEESLGVLQQGQILVNTSTTHPQVDAYYAEQCTRAGATWVDAPVTWRPQGLIVMVGGEAEAYQRVLPILQTFAYRVVHVGEVGSGQKLKAVNQLILADQLPELIRDALELPVPEAVRGEEFAGGGQLALHYKDLGYILELAHEHESAIPVTSLVHEIFKATKRFGDSNWTQPGIVTFWRRLNS